MDDLQQYMEAVSRLRKENDELRSALLDAVSELEHYNPDMSRALYLIAKPGSSTQDDPPAAGTRR
jgi:hypothetical protein